MRRRVSVWMMAAVLCACLGGFLATVSQAAKRGHIIGGTTATQGSYPYMAWVFDDQDGMTGGCSGTLVASNIVLTAGHCAENVNTGVVNDASGYQIVTGAVDYNDTSHSTVTHVSKVIVNPTFVPSTLDGDAALLVLSAPVSSPTVALATSTPPAGTTGTIAGWGETSYSPTQTTEVLQYGPTQMQSQSFCATHSPSGYSFDSSTQLCVLDSPSDSVGTCEGDSGGPFLVQDTSGNVTEVGLASLGPLGCDPKYPDIFTAVPPIEAWIEQQIQANPPPAPTTTTSTTSPTSTPTTSTTPPPVTTTQSTPTRPVIPTLPRLTLTSAQGYVRQTLASSLGAVFSHRGHYLSTCTRVSSPRFSCAVTFTSGANYYHGTVAIFYRIGEQNLAYYVFWGSSYTVDRVNDHCYFKSGHPKRCAVKVKRGGKY